MKAPKRSPEFDTARVLGHARVATLAAATTAAAGYNGGMWLPDPLYEALPFIYPVVGVGSVSMFGIDSPALLSALLFCTASVVIVRLRRRHRAEQRAVDEARTRNRRRRAKRRLEF